MSCRTSLILCQVRPVGTRRADLSPIDGRAPNTPPSRDDSSSMSGRLDSESAAETELTPDTDTKDSSSLHRELCTQNVAPPRGHVSPPRGHIPPPRGYVQKLLVNTSAMKVVPGLCVEWRHRVCMGGGGEGGWGRREVVLVWRGEEGVYETRGGGATWVKKQ